MSLYMLKLLTYFMIAVFFKESFELADMKQAGNDSQGFNWKTCNG